MIPGPVSTERYWYDRFVELEAKTFPAAPDGWKLVPVEATSEMEKDGAYQASGVTRKGAKCIYRAMLSAAPVPPSGGVIVAAREALEATRYYFEALHDSDAAMAEAATRAHNLVRAALTRCRRHRH